MSAADFDLVMREHVRGTWLTSRAAARRWREAAKADPSGRVYGRVVNTTSGAGLWGNFGQTNYATAKAAIVGLTQTLSLELARIGVTVNAISPGGITRLSAAVSGAASVPEPDERPEDEFDPKDPSLSSPVVAWLASPEAAHVSGQVVRAMGELIELAEGWTKGPSISNGGKRWDATTLGDRMAKDVFRTRAPMMSTTRSASRPEPSPDTELPRSLTITVAPCLASSRACPRPIPWPAPVTSAILPSSRGVMRSPPGRPGGRPAR
jgi:hypothetical protein